MNTVPCKACIVCGITIRDKPSHMAHRVYCSWTCRQAESAAARFGKKMDTGGECWTWEASRNSEGYGVFYPKGRAGGPVLAHRWAFELAVGPIPDGLFVCHHCDNPACVRPSHLFLGTPGDNMDDKVAKGRAARGERVGGAKLTEEAVREIRRLRSDEGLSACKLAGRFGVTPQAIGYLLQGRTWRHVQ